MTAINSCLTYSSLKHFFSLLYFQTNMLCPLRISRCERQHIYIKIHQAAPNHQNTQRIRARIPAENAYHVGRAIRGTVGRAVHGLPLQQVSAAVRGARARRCQAITKHEASQLTSMAYFHHLPFLSSLRDHRGLDVGICQRSTTG